MKKSLFNYLTERYDDSKVKQVDKGPVVTISRQYGCSGNIIARKIIEEIETNTSLSKKDVNWKWFNKEILELSAKELDIPEYIIEQMSTTEKKGLFGDIINAFGKHYTNDKTVRKTLMTVLANIADEGFAIIVGRGAVAISRDIQRSLHISLQAPLKWRVAQVSKKRNMPANEVEKIAIEIDKKRKLLIDRFFGITTDNFIFDLIINPMTMTEEEIVRTIIELMKIKKFI